MTTTTPGCLEAAAAERKAAQTTALGVLFAVSASHMLNDTMQSLAPALYPVFREKMALTFFQTGIITFVFQVSASLLQPMIGLAADRRPMPFLLPVGMAFTLAGLVGLAFASTYPLLLAAVAVIGVGSAVFHPEASRVARAASGGRHGFAQSVFQVGGNFGQSTGPLLAAFVVVPFGQHSVLAFTALAAIAVALLIRVSRWHRDQRARKRQAEAAAPRYPRATVVWTITALIILLFSKVLYMSSLGSYYTFYLMQEFGVSVQTSQILLFVFLASVAVGTFFGGPLADRFGAKTVIWGSIVGVLPFTLALPHLGLVGTAINSVAIGLVLSSAFSAVVVYAQELTPGNVGAVAGLFFGLSFGLGGIGAALLGMVADYTSLRFVYEICAFLPAIGFLAAFLPNPRPEAA
ncbi:FSR family fosmidomycin resistance protein-like MFS transporter [Roseiarcus fermentans]|uniref:FSR family fosmidomycin resistance protein-like MFS transporter n=1 Tax=Roseiarcus fermentans TaxID=1473586 RepID=A0A366FRB7_9HYPH|nr:MFS transporter [Roseiarcus fermentans]RBP17224.1 FSR family fosmidomycin resistance protein-like MFS transporter [Roseiarcus fermentans]